MLLYGNIEAIMKIFVCNNFNQSSLTTVFCIVDITDVYSYVITFLQLVIKHLSAVYAQFRLPHFGVIVNQETLDSQAVECIPPPSRPL